jgi:hypothetical protein
MKEEGNVNTKQECVVRNKLQKNKLGRRVRKRKIKSGNPSEDFHKCDFSSESERDIFLV